MSVIEDSELMTLKKFRKYTGKTPAQANVKPMMVRFKCKPKRVPRYPLMIRNPVLRVQTYEGCHGWDKFTGPSSFKAQREMLVNKLAQGLSERTGLLDVIRPKRMLAEAASGSKDQVGEGAEDIEDLCHLDSWSRS